MHTTLATTAAAAAVAASLLATAPAAHAVGPHGPEQRTCAQQVSAVADGTVYGAGDCGGGVTVQVRPTGGAWRSLGVMWPDKRVEAVAADETATFVVMSCTTDDRGCRAGDPLGKTFYVGKLPHGGRASALTELGTTEGSDTAAVAARGGTWWAAWGSTTRFRQGDSVRATRRVLYRKTFGGRGSGDVPVPRTAAGERTSAADPAIALTRHGAVLAFTTQAEESDTSSLIIATAGTDGVFSSSPFAPAAGAAAATPDITVSGGRTLVSWSRDGRPALAYGTGPGARRVDLPYRGTVSGAGPQIAASGGFVTVTTAETFTYAAGQTTRVYTRSLDSSGALRSTTELTAPAGRQSPTVQAALGDSTAARGRATVVYRYGNTRVSRTQH